jgi:hypothetical protein
MHPDDAIDLLGKKGRLFQDNALMPARCARFKMPGSPADTTLPPHSETICSWHAKASSRALIGSILK